MIERKLRELVEEVNRVIPGGDCAIRYKFPIGTVVSYRDFEYPLGIGIGPDHVLTASEQSSILRNLGLEEFADRFGLDWHE